MACRGPFISLLSKRKREKYPTRFPVVKIDLLAVRLRFSLAFCL